MNNKKLVPLLVSAAMTLLVWQLYLASQEENRELSMGMISVVTAAQDIPPQKPIQDGWITTKEIPARFVQPGAFREKVPGLNRKKILGKIAPVAIPMGAQLTSSMLKTPSADAGGISVKLASGQRGYLLRLSNVEIAKLILPGDRIDILATFPVKTKQGQAASRATITILQNILVISVGVNIVDTTRDEKAETKEERVLTLAVEPQEAQRLTHSQVESQGEISIVVRAHGDDQIARLAPVQTAHLAKPEAQAKMPPAKP